MSHPSRSIHVRGPPQADNRMTVLDVIAIV